MGEVTGHGVAMILLLALALMPTTAALLPADALELAQIVTAVGWHESRWRIDRVSRCGAVGPMQVRPRWARKGQLCEGMDLRSLVGGVECGARLLREGLRLCGSWPRALGWYSTGRCRETRYARVVMRRR